MQQNGRAAFHLLPASTLLTGVKLSAALKAAEAFQGRRAFTRETGLAFKALLTCPGVISVNLINDVRNHDRFTTIVLLWPMADVRFCCWWLLSQHGRHDVIERPSAATSRFHRCCLSGRAATTVVVTGTGLQHTTMERCYGGELFAFSRSCTP